MTVTLDDIRKALVQGIEAARIDMPVEVEYRHLAEVNLDTQTEPFLAVNILMYDGYQLNLGPNAGNRLLGTLVLEAKYKKGSGLSKALKILEHFYRRMHMTDMHYPVRTYAMRPSSRAITKDWLAEAAIIPFWADSIPG